MDRSATLRYRNYEEEKSVQFTTKAEKYWNFVEKLQVAKKKLAPIVDEVINTTTRSNINSRSKLTSSLTSQQYEDVLWASKVLREIKYDFKNNAVSNKKLWKNYKFPNTFIINNVRVPISAASEGKNVLINESVIAELLDLYQQLGVVIGKIWKDDNLKESKLLSSESENAKSENLTKKCSCDSIEQLIDSEARASSNGDIDSITKLVSSSQVRGTKSRSTVKSSRSKSLPRDICECPQSQMGVSKNSIKVPKNYCSCKDENVVPSKSTRFTSAEDNNKFESSKSRMLSTPNESNTNALQKDNKSKSAMYVNPEDRDEAFLNSRTSSTRSGLLMSSDDRIQSKSTKSFGGNPQNVNSKSSMLDTSESRDQSKSTKSIGGTQSESGKSSIYGRNAFDKSTIDVNQTKLAKSASSATRQKSGNSKSGVGIAPNLERSKSKTLPPNTSDNNNGTIYITIKCFSDVDDNGDESDDLCSPSSTCEETNDKHVHVKLDGQPVTVKVNQENIDGDAVYHINAENDQEENIKIIIKKCPGCYSTVVASSSRIQKVVEEGPQYQDVINLPSTDVGDSHESITLHGKSDINSDDLTLSSDEDTRPDGKSSNDIGSNKQMSVLLDVDDLNKSIIEFEDKNGEPRSKSIVNIDDATSERSETSTMSVKDPSRISMREQSDPSGILVKGPSRTSVKEQPEPSRSFTGDQPDPSRISLKSATDPSRTTVEPDRIASSKNVKINTRSFIPLVRRKICSSMEFDVDMVESKLRDGIEHPNPNIIVQLKNLGVNQLLRACRPAKCCRKAILNEKQRTALPYGISLKSLPLDRSDMQIIEQSIDMSMWKVKTPKDLGEHNKNKLAYYINLGQDDFNSSINFPWVIPSYNVNCLELDSEFENDSESNNESKLSVLNKPKHFHLHKSSGKHCLFQQLKKGCQCNNEGKQPEKPSGCVCFSEILPCLCKKNIIKKENYYVKLNKADKNLHGEKGSSEFTHEIKTKLMDDSTNCRYLNQSIIMEGGDNCNISIFDKTQDFEEYLEAMDDFSEELKQFNNDYEGKKLYKANVVNRSSKSKSYLTKSLSPRCTKDSEILGIRSSSVSLYISCRQTSIKLDKKLTNIEQTTSEEVKYHRDGTEVDLSFLAKLLSREALLQKKPHNNLNYYINLVENNFAWNKNVPLITPLIEARFFNYTPANDASSPDRNKSTINLANGSGVNMQPAKSQYYNHPDEHDDFVHLSDRELARRKSVEENDPAPNSSIRGGRTSSTYSEVSEPPTSVSTRRNSKKLTNFEKGSSKRSEISYTKVNTEQPRNVQENRPKATNQNSSDFKIANTGFSFFPNERESIIFEPWAPHLISIESLPLDRESTQPVEETVGKQEAKGAEAVPFTGQVPKKQEQYQKKDKCLGTDGRCIYLNSDSDGNRLLCEKKEDGKCTRPLEQRSCLGTDGRCTYLNSDSDGNRLLCEKKEDGKCTRPLEQRSCSKNNDNTCSRVPKCISSTHDVGEPSRKAELQRRTSEMANEDVQMCRSVPRHRDSGHEASEGKSRCPKSTQCCPPSIRIEIQQTGRSKPGGLNSDINNKKCDEAYVVIQKKPCSREACAELKNVESKSRNIYKPSICKMTGRSKSGDFGEGSKRKDEGGLEPKEKKMRNKDDSKNCDVACINMQKQPCTPEICEVYKNAALIKAYQKKSRRDDTKSNSKSRYPDRR